MPRHVSTVSKPPLSAATFVQCELELLMLSGRCNLCPGSIRCACAHRLPTAGSSSVVSRHELRVSAVTPEARRGRALAALSSCVHGSTQWLLGQPGHATVSYWARPRHAACSCCYAQSAPRSRRRCVSMGRPSGSWASEARPPAPIELGHDGFWPSR
jgi:hypothetical protein